MRIVIVEDNEALASGIAYRLRDDGHAVDQVTRGDVADSYLREESGDLIILDINLPGMSGIELLKKLRGRGESAPVLLLTARNETSDRIIGLDAGADDYLAKPFEMDELMARVRALLRRRATGLVTCETLGNLSFNRATRQASINDVPLHLPRRELATLECLIDRRGRMVSKSELADFIYGVGSEFDDRNVEVHVSRLRRHLKDTDIFIKSARGLGYTLDVGT